MGMNPIILEKIQHHHSGPFWVVWSVVASLVCVYALVVLWQTRPWKDD